jgi:hypothetical protein
MASLELRVKTKNSDKLHIELDAGKFEKLLADFGYFSDDFIKSVERAEADFRGGKCKKIRSLKELSK